MGRAIVDEVVFVSFAFFFLVRRDRTERFLDLLILLVPYAS